MEWDCLLSVDEKAAVRHDISSLVEMIIGSSGVILDGGAATGISERIPEESLGLLDWEWIHSQLIAYREAAGYRNLLIPMGAARAVMEARDPAMYELVAPDGLVRPERYEGVQTLERVVVEVLRRYVDSYYRLAQRRWDARHLEYRKLTVCEPNFQDYAVRVPTVIKAAKARLERDRTY